MEEYLEIRLDIFEHRAEPVRVRKTLKISELIDEILKEFDDIPSESPQGYEICIKGSKKPIPRHFTLSQADIQPQDELILEYEPQNDPRDRLSEHQRAYLRDEGDGRIYSLEWSPALIGRPSKTAEQNILLAVNLQHHPHGMTVSRRHAQITLENGRYFLQALSEDNPTVLNKRIVPPASRVELQHDDKFFLGKHLQMTFLTSKPDEIRSAVQESASIPRSPLSETDSRTVIGESSLSTPLRLLIEASQSGVGQVIELSLPARLGRKHPLLENDREVSREHVEFHYDPDKGQVHLRDLGSRNGTFLNGVRLTSDATYILPMGVRLQLGSHVVLVRQG